MQISANHWRARRFSVRRRARTVPDIREGTRLRLWWPVDSICEDSLPMVLGRS